MWTKKISYQKHCLLVSFSMGLLVIGGCFPIPQPDARHIIEAAKTIEGLSSREVQVQSLNRVLL